MALFNDENREKIGGETDLITLTLCVCDVFVLLCV